MILLLSSSMSLPSFALSLSSSAFSLFTSSSSYLKDLRVNPSVKDDYYFDEALLGPTIICDGDYGGVVVVGGCHHVAVDVDNNIRRNSTRHLKQNML